MNFTTGIDADHNPCTSVLIFIIVINISNNHNDNDHISGFCSQLARNRTTVLLRQHIKLNQSYFLVRGKRLGKKLTEQRREPENSNHAWPGVRASGPVPHSHWWVASARY